MIALAVTTLGRTAESAWVLLGVAWVMALLGLGLESGSWKDRAWNAALILAGFSTGVLIVSAFLAIWGVR